MNELDAMRKCCHFLAKGMGLTLLGEDMDIDEYHDFGLEDGEGRLVAGWLLLPQMWEYLQSLAASLTSDEGLPCNFNMREAR